MAFTNQQNFIAELDGTTLRDLTQKLDYSLTSFEDRMNLVKSILNGTQFFNLYFSDHFKASINAGDVLSSDVNVCHALERFTDYILNSKEVKQEEDKEKTQYVFHSDPNYFQKKLNREVKMSQLSGGDGGNDSDSNVIHFIKRASGNTKKPKKQKITPKDLSENTEVGRILNDYNNFLTFITQELKKKDSKFNRFLLTKTKGEVQNDMIYTKDHLKGVFGYDLKGFNESTKLYLDVFDFTNKLHLLGGKITDESGKLLLNAKGLLYFNRSFVPGDDWDLVLMDLQNTIDQANLTPKELETLEMMRSNMRPGEIAHELKIHHQEVARLIDRIAVKITRVGNKYDAEKDY